MPTQITAPNPPAAADRAPRYRAVYAYYPRGLRTGGPEALHQFVDTLRRAGVDAYLVPLPGSEHESRVPQFAHYDAPEAPSVPDEPGVAVVTAEDTMPLLYRFRHAEPVCWWLSVDQSSVFLRRKRLWTLKIENPFLAAKWFATLGMNALIPFRAARVRRATRMRHLSQSEYARDYVSRNLGIDAGALTDFTVDADALTAAARADREPFTVAYNPAKGKELSQALIASAPAHWRFVPLVGMSRDELVGALGSSVVYLDLGHHPGKDRIPREAALAGAVVVVARRGSGAFDLDVPIPVRFKVSPGRRGVEEARQVLEQVFADPAAARAAQDDYRRAVVGERERFEAEVLAAFR